MERRAVGLLSHPLLALPLLSLPLTTLGLTACGGNDVGATGGFTSAAETQAGDGDGDNNSGNSETNGNSAGDGDGTPGDGDGDGTPGDGDGTPGDGDGTPGDGDGDGMPPECATNDDCLDPNLPICSGGTCVPCSTDDDCTDPASPLCADTGACVPCTPANDICAIGQYCDDTNLCVVGCIEDADCPNPLVCDVNNNVCTGCVEDMNCPLGSICEAGDCVPGCTDQQPCQMGFSCCGGDCQDLANDPQNCGMCGMACPDFPNAADLCTDGLCEPGACEGNWHDCDGNPVNGCETQAQCLCVPGEQIDCYSGFPANTEGVGLCHAGTRTCNAMGTGYGACIGEVIPATEVCNSGQDENCDGQVDENPDLDGDGWGVCDNDCCDQVNPDCSTPTVVNPGAFEVPADMVDNDCDGQIDNVLALCDGNLAVNNGNPLDYARAIDLCQFTTLNPPLAQRVWGVINGWFYQGNGVTVNPSTNARSIRPQFGNAITPQLGSRIALFSTGRASYPNAPAPTWAAYQDGQDLGAFDVTAPADWLAANGNSFPNAPGCPGANSTTAHDSIMLKLQVRVPTNANSFSAKMYFFSAEYPEYVCTAFNDLFVTLVTSSDPGNPADKNIAIYTQGNNSWPVGVNLLKAANGLFKQCSNGQITQCGNPLANYNGCLGTNELAGTGFDQQGATLYSCNYAGRHGGGTGWLTMSGNVTPGETMEIRFVIWDTADGLFDSSVLLDSWQWSVQAAQPGVQPG